jgi:hypothetical protein
VPLLRAHRPSSTWGAGACRTAPSPLAGLGHVRRTSVPLEFAWSSPRAFAAYHRTSPLARLVVDADLGRQAEAWEAVATVAARRWGSGPFSLPGQVVIVSGRR